MSLEAPRFSIKLLIITICAANLSEVVQTASQIALGHDIRPWYIQKM